MAPSSLPRTLITEHILAELKTLGHPVGDMTNPKEPHGWTKTEPNADASNFVPWYSLSVGPASAPTGSIGDSATEYELVYSTTMAGVSRAQTERLGDIVRKHFTTLERTSLTHQPTGERWRIIQLRATRVGAIQKVSGSFPDYFVEADEFRVRVSKGVTP